jgi:subtilisin family serine protease
MPTTFPTPINGDRFALILTPDEAYVEFGGSMGMPAIETFLDRHDLTLVGDGEVEEGSEVPPDVEFDRCWVRLGHGTIDDFVNEVADDADVRVVGPVYHRPDMLPVKTGVTYVDELLVAFATDATASDIDGVLRDRYDDLIDRFGGPDRWLHVVRIADYRPQEVLARVAELAASPHVRYVEPNWGQLRSPFAAIPNDRLFPANTPPPSQWNLTHVEVDRAWDITTGDPSVVVAVIDSGCHLAHPDLQNKVSAYYEAVTGSQIPVNPFPFGFSGDFDLQEFGGHGTRVASVVAAATNNDDPLATNTDKGMAGFAWECMAMPINVVVPILTVNGIASLVIKDRVAAAISWAHLHGARVINMSLDLDDMLPTPTDAIGHAIEDAYNAGIVLVAAAGNHAQLTTPPDVTFPARHPCVIAAGATARWGGNDDAWWFSSIGPHGSQYGDKLDVVAPGSEIYSAKRDGKVNSLFNATSAASPHVAGVAALLCSAYPSLTPREVRSIIIKTADKVPPYPYVDPYVFDPVFPDGTRSERFGYGRINAYHALDLADVYIRDHPHHDGTMAWIGDFWSDSDIVVRQANDGIFDHQPALMGQANYIYVRVRNLGPAVATGVEVSVRAVPFPGTEFLGPDGLGAGDPGDWALVDGTHLAPAPITSAFATVPVGGTVTAVFEMTTAQVALLYALGHPCLLASVKCARDHAWTAGPRSGLDNNLAQRSITIETITPLTTRRLVFVAGHVGNSEPHVDLLVDRSDLDASWSLFLDPLNPPSIPGAAPIDQPPPTSCALLGASVAVWQGNPVIQIQALQAVVRYPRAAGTVAPMRLICESPVDVVPGEHRLIHVAQRNMQGLIVGGIAWRLDT